MKTTTALIAAALALAATSTFAAGKSCEELKAEIAAKLDAKKVAGYTLDIVDAAKAADDKQAARVVGTDSDVAASGRSSKTRPASAERTRARSHAEQPVFSGMCHVRRGRVRRIQGGQRPFTRLETFVTAWGSV